MRKSIVGMGLALAAAGSTLTQIVSPRPLQRAKGHVDELIGLAASIFDGKTEGDKQRIIDAEAKRQRKAEKRAQLALMYGMTPAKAAAGVTGVLITTDMPPPNPVHEAVFGKPNVKAAIGPTRKIDRSPEAMEKKIMRDKITKQAKRDFEKGNATSYSNPEKQAIYDRVTARLEGKRK